MPYQCDILTIVFHAEDEDDFGSGYVILLGTHNSWSVGINSCTGAKTIELPNQTKVTFWNKAYIYHVY